MGKSSGVMRFKVSPIDIIAFIYCTTLFEIWGSLRVPVELLCVGCFVIQHFSSKRSFLLRSSNKYYFWAFAFTLMCALSVLYSKNAHDAYLGTRMFLETFIAGFAVLLYVDSNDRLIKILKYTTVAAVVFFFKILLTNPLQTILTQRQLGSINANSVGMKMAICAVIIIWLLKEKKITILKAVLILAVLLPAIIVSGSKKAIFILLFGVAFLLLLYQKNILKILGYVALAAAVLYGAYYLLMHNQVLYSFMGQRVEGLVNALLYGYASGDRSTRGRIDMIQIAIREWKDNPIIGYGINTFGIYNGISEFGSVNMYSHCNYTELLFGVGIVGTLIYYSIFPWLIVSQLRTFRSSAVQKIYLTIIVILLIIDIGMVSYLDEFMQAQIVFASAACLFAFSNEEKELS